MPLDPVAERRERAHLIVGDARRVPRAAPPRGGAAARHRADDEALVAKPPLENLAAGRLHHEVIGVNRAGDHRFAEPGARVDDGLAAASRHRVGREQHARHRGVDHPLDHDGEGTVRGSMPLVAR